MRRWNLAAIAIVFTLGAHAARAEPLSPAITAIIDAAADDPASLEVVVKAVKKANPDAVTEIDSYVAALTARVAAKKAERVAEQGFFEGWTGKAEFGGSAATGNTVDYGVTAAIALNRNTPRWEHDFDFMVTYKNEDEQTTTDRYFLTYSIIRNLSPRLYAGTILWGERDRFAGYNYRFSEGLGLGYRLVQTPKLTLKVEGGPALRQSQYLVNGYESTTAVRMAGYLTWLIRPNLEFRQDLVTYRDSKNSTILSTTAVTMKLQGDFSARASYELRNEENPPGGREPTDTTTRATLVYGF